MGSPGEIKHEIRNLKLVFLGERQSGKTTLINRILNDAPLEKSYNVIVDKVKKNITVTTTKGNVIELHLVDTSGSERCRSTIASFIRHSTNFIVVYDVTDAESFRVTCKWVDVIRAEHGHDSIISLVGNKCELHDQRQVSTEEGKRRAEELHAMFIETSAVAGPNVAILFHDLVSAIVNENRKEAGYDEFEDNWCNIC